MAEPLDREFAKKLLLTFDDPEAHGVHLLFNEWWRHAPPEVREEYLADFDSVPEQRAFVEARWFAEPLDLDALAALPEGSLGRAYGDFIRKHGLEKNIAVNYRALHEHMERQGALANMPDAMKYAVLRGFQTHDFQHVVTGYDPSRTGELALQAFCLAQIRFPYFGMWMSVVTTRMTFLHPRTIRPVMDAITDGWRLGRQVGNLQFTRWEERLEEPLAELRREHGLDPAGRAPLEA